MSALCPLFLANRYSPTRLACQLFARSRHPDQFKRHSRASHPRRGWQNLRCNEDGTARFRPRRSAAGSRPRLARSSKFAEQNQNQHDDEDEAETAAAVIAGPVKGTATEPAQTPE